jgi:hypothetical protein
LNRVRYAVRRGPQNPFRFFAFVAGVRLATAICSTATSRTNRIVEINSGSKFDGISFGDDDDFSTGNLLLANVVYPSRESAV